MRAEAGEVAPLAMPAAASPVGEPSEALQAFTAASRAAPALITEAAAPVASTSTGPREAALLISSNPAKGSSDSRAAPLDSHQRSDRLLFAIHRLQETETAPRSRCPLNDWGHD